jgi:ABC-type amino acid transport substrate-binding protein
MVVTALSCLWLSAAPGFAEPVRITHGQPFPPFAEVKNGKSEGLAVDILRAAAAPAGMDLEFVPAPIDQMQQTLKDGRAEGIFMAVTPESLQSFDSLRPTTCSRKGRSQSLCPKAKAPSSWPV